MGQNFTLIAAGSATLSQSDWQMLCQSALYGCWSDGFPAAGLSALTARHHHHLTIKVKL